MAGTYARKAGKIDAAKEYLTNRLMYGPVPANDLMEEAEAQNIGVRTLKSAKSEMPISSIKKDGCWYWEMKSE